MVRETTDAEKREIRRLLSSGSPSTTSRFAPANAEPSNLEPTPAPSRFRQAASAAGRVGRLALSGKAFAAAAIPGVEEEDIENLPWLAEFAIDNLLSPVGLAALAATPVTGGGSIAAKLGITALANKPLAVRSALGLAEYIATDLAAAGAGTLAAKAVDKLLPEDTDPSLRTGLVLGAGLLGGVGTGVGISKAVKPALKGTVAGEALDRADLSIPELLPLNVQVSHLRSFHDLPVLGDTLAGNPVVREFAKVIDPTKNIDTRNRYAALHAVVQQQENMIPQAGRAYLATKHGEGFKSLWMDKKGNMLLEGKRIPLLEALSDDLGRADEVQKPVLARIKGSIDEATKVYKETAPASKQIDKPWVPEFGKDGRLINGVDRRYDDFVDTARIARLDTRDALLQPDSLINVYVQTAMKSRLRAQVDELYSDFLIKADDVYANTAEGKVLKQALDETLQEARRFRGERVDFPLTPELKKKLKTTSAAWSEYKKSTRPHSYIRVKPDGTTETVPVSRYGKGFLEISEDELEKIKEWTNNQVRPGTPVPFAKPAQELADMSRFTQASFDMSAAFINNLPVLFSNPEAWAKSLAANWHSVFINPNKILRDLADPENARVLDRMIKHNVVPGDFEQFVSAARGGWAHKALSAPGAQPIKAVSNRLQIGYEAALIKAKLEAWKAYEQVPMFRMANGLPDERRIANILRKETGSMNTAVMGIAPSQRTLESILFFSPRMFRSISALMGSAVRPWTPEGAVAAHTVLRMLGASAGMFMVANMASGIMSGKSDEQIKKDMEASANPMNGRQFLSVRIGDEWYGIGGQVRAVTQALARSISDEDTKAGKDNNPIYDFFSGRLGPAPRFIRQTAELSLNEDWAPFESVEDFPDWLEAQGKGFLPFYIGNALEEGGLPGLADPSMLIDIAGLSSKERTASDVLDSAAFRRHNMQWSDLNQLEQDTIRADHPELEKKAQEMLSAEDRQYKTAISRNDTRTYETLLAVNESNLTQKDKRERIEEVLRDRWLANKTTAEDFNRASGIGAADTPKRQVLDAYYNTFKEAGIGPEGTTQTDWDKWEDLQADLDLRIKAGEFGEPARAQAYIDERREFKLPPELSWYKEAKKVVKDAQYWEQKDVAFAEISDVITNAFPDVSSARELEQKRDEAEMQGDLFAAKRIEKFINVLNNRTEQKRKLLKLNNPELKVALTALGR